MRLNRMLSGSCQCVRYSIMGAMLKGALAQQISLLSDNETENREDTRERSTRGLRSMPYGTLRGTVHWTRVKCKHADNYLLPKRLAKVQILPEIPPVIFLYP